MFDLGHIGDNVTKGVAYFAKMGRLAEDAEKKGDMATLKECLHCLGTFAGEILEEGGYVVKHNLPALLFTSDPTADSRHEAQGILTKHGIK